MNIKTILAGSATALASFSHAQAGDAIVAAETEAVEYVRFCDAYGSGYFYIPGTETCLKINGYIRFQVNAGPNAVLANTFGTGTSDWEALTRGQLQITAKSDMEYGTLTGVVVLQTNADSGTGQVTRLDSAYIDIAGFRAGLLYSWWDEDLSGDTDDLKSKTTLHNSIRYQYQSGDFYAGLSLDELEDGYFSSGQGLNNKGISFGIGGKIGALNYQITGGYDGDNEEGAIRAIGNMAIGLGTLGFAGVYSSAPNSYYQTAEWIVAVQYATTTDKVKIIPGFQYYGNYGIMGGKFNNNNDAWKVGVTFDYQIVENLYAKATINYLEQDQSKGVTTGFFRLQRAF